VASASEKLKKMLIVGDSDAALSQHLEDWLANRRRQAAMR